MEQTVDEAILWNKPSKRPILGGFAGECQGHRELSKFVNPSDTGGFTAQKKPVG